MPIFSSLFSRRFQFSVIREFYTYLCRILSSERKCVSRFAEFWSTTDGFNIRWESNNLIPYKHNARSIATQRQIKIVVFDSFFFWKWLALAQERPKFSATLLMKQTQATTAMYVIGSLSYGGMKLSCPMLSRVLNLMWESLTIIPIWNELFSSNQRRTYTNWKSWIFHIIIGWISAKGKFYMAQLFWNMGTIGSCKTYQRHMERFASVVTWDVCLSVDYRIKSAERMARGIYFPDGIIDSSIVMIEHVEPRKPNIWAFFLPFQPAVWILIACTILITCSISGFWNDLITLPMSKPWIHLLLTLSFTQHYYSLNTWSLNLWHIQLVCYL